MVKNDQKKNALRDSPEESISDQETREGLPEKQKRLSSSLTAEMSKGPSEKI